MAEFDATGFSAVAAFFGEDHPSVGNTRTRKIEHVASSEQRRGRKGVGAIAENSQSSTLMTTKRLMQVGNRKQRADDDDSDIEQHERRDEDSEEDNTDEVVNGRTSIQEKKPKIATEISLEKSKTKKKAGKKERKSMAVAVAESSNRVHGGKEFAEVDYDMKEEEVTRTQEQKETDEEEMNRKRKRKKQKIRSRQKNIRKDTRLAQHKPDHLIFGRTGFHGRPLTAETRAKLNLPPSKTSKKHTRFHETDDEGAMAEKESLPTDLAIDSFLDVGIVASSEPSAKREESHEEQMKKRKKPNKKKSKYKNLT